MQIIQSPHIFVMKQKIKTLDDVVETSTMGYTDSRRIQIQTFGGKKSKQVYVNLTYLTNTKKNPV
jgi:hypothetical protein